MKGTYSLFVPRLLCMCLLAVVLAACGGNGGQGPEPTSFTLTVAKSGTGSGTVRGTNIDCGEDCTESLAQGTSVMLNATPDSGSTFAGWGGACSGTTTCSVSMDSDKAVTATFNQGSGEPPPPPSAPPAPPSAPPAPPPTSGSAWSN